MMVFAHLFVRPMNPKSLNFVKASPVSASLFVLRQLPGDTVLKFKCFFRVDAAGRRA